MKVKMFSKFEKKEGKGFPLSCGVFVYRVFIYRCIGCLLLVMVKTVDALRCPAEIYKRQDHLMNLATRWYLGWRFARKTNSATNVLLQFYILYFSLFLFSFFS